MKKFIIDALKYYSIIAIIPAIGLYLSLDIGLGLTFVLYIILTVVLIILAGIVQLAHNYKDRKKNI